LGTYIQADGLTQSGGIVESTWKDTLRRVRNSNHKIRNVLILGLGGGTVANLIRKKWPEAKITGVDIDPIIVELGEKYLGLDRDGIEMKIGDVLQIIKQFKNKRFDLIIVDLYNGDKFPAKFESSNFLSFARGGLANGGIVIFNRLFYKEKKAEALEFGKKLQQSFSKVEYFYPHVNIMFICGD
jgi:spermidine synthase